MASQSMLFMLLLLTPNFLPFCLSSSTNFSSSSPTIGINYGQIADNLPPPSSVLPLLRSLGAARVKLFDVDPVVLRSFAGTGVEFIVGLPDRLIPKVIPPSAALAWVKSNIQPHLPATQIAALTVGNEVFSGNDSVLFRSLLPAMQSLHSALATLGLEGQVAVTTAHSLAVLAVSYPPSAAAFRRDILPYVCPLLTFLGKTGAPFLINAYPYFAYKANPKTLDLNYVLFESNAGVVDAGTGLRYTNMLHSQVDAVRAAISAANNIVEVDTIGAPISTTANKRSVEVVVSETGWPSAGDDDEAGATVENARRYNGNLMRMVSEGKGTPAAPDSPLRVFVFALFNENLKPGPSSERHYGLFKPDGTPAYDMDGEKGEQGVAVNASGIEGGDGAESPAAGTKAAEGSYASYWTFSAGVLNTEIYWSSAILTVSLVIWILSAPLCARS